MIPEPGSPLPPPFPDGSFHDDAVIENFRDLIYTRYRTEGRLFPWRETRDPYRILLSEMMLQQTQTERVLPKYELFLSQWPTLTALSEASLTDILTAWQGLGYNRRALALRRVAGISAEHYGGSLPRQRELLLELPMVGPATSAALLAFAFGKPSLYLETNIRRVLLYFFFFQREKVRDSELYEALELLLDRSDPRSWYYALMDYGVFLRRHTVNPNRRSAHYTRQAAFRDSNRQIRGELLRLLTQAGAMDVQRICELLDFPEERITNCLQALCDEGFLETAESQPTYKLR